MKKLTLVAVLFLLPGVAQAQFGLQGVVDDYCVEVDRDADEAVDELVDATADLLDCENEFLDCLDGFGKPEPLECAVDVKECQVRARKDQYRGCNELLNEFKRATRDAERTADRKDVEADFVDWFFGRPSRVDDPTSDECLERTRAITEFCAGIIDIDDIP